jgi:hypothetical protein
MFASISVSTECVCTEYLCSNMVACFLLQAVDM